MAAASRPVTPSRRNEKKREGCSTVQSPLPVMWRTPARISRRRASCGRLASQRAEPSCAVRGTKQLLIGLSRGLIESLQHLCTDFELPCTDARPEPHRHIPWRALRRFAERLQRSLDHATGQATPAGVRRRHRTSVGSGQQNRHAVRHLHRAGDAGLVSPGGVGLQRLGIGICAGHSFDLRAMHLAQPHRRRAERRREAAPVLRYRERIVATGRAQVQTVPGRDTGSAQARAHQGADTIAGGPCRPQHLGFGQCR